MCLTSWASDHHEADLYAWLQWDQPSVQARLRVPQWSDGPRAGDFLLREGAPQGSLLNHAPLASCCASRGTCGGCCQPSAQACPCGHHLQQCQQWHGKWMVCSFGCRMADELGSSCHHPSGPPPCRMFQRHEQIVHGQLPSPRTWKSRYPQASWPMATRFQQSTGPWYHSKRTDQCGHPPQPPKALSSACSGTGHGKQLRKVVLHVQDRAECSWSSPWCSPCAPHSQRHEASLHPSSSESWLWRSGTYPYGTRGWHGPWRHKGPADRWFPEAKLQQSHKNITRLAISCFPPCEPLTYSSVHRLEGIIKLKLRGKNLFRSQDQDPHDSSCFLLWGMDLQQR